MKEDKGDVKFVRIRGKIVPIKSKGGSGASILGVSDAAKNFARPEKKRRKR